MTYKQLIDKLADVRDMPKSRARELLEGIFDTMQEELGNGKGVSIPQLGTFKTKTRESRKVFSPHHETFFMVPPKRVVDFSPSINLKENLKFVEVEDD